jgi:DDE superfamily endonuclease
MNIEPLQNFRQEAYRLLTRAKDATFELMDAVMTTRHASSLAEFSLSPMFHRQYPSTYEALEDSRPQRNQLMKWESPIGKATWQLKQFMKHCQQKMLVLLDREYGNAQWVLATAELKVDCIMRMRSNACLWGVPKTYSDSGRPPIHGKKFQFTDVKTWGDPDSSMDLEDPVSGRVRVRMWTELHFRKAAKNQVNLILVERLKPTGSGRIMPPL